MLCHVDTADDTIQTHNISFTEHAMVNVPILVTNAGSP